MADTWTSLFGSHLITKDGVKPTDEVLAGKKVVGIYFSAHWCPPCRGFTPVLSATYDDLVEEHSDVEIVFVSSDQDQNGFDTYYKDMPFLALPYENREGHKELSQKFGVRSIPTLVFLNEKGEIITSDGRMMVVEAEGDVDKLYSALSK